MEYLHVTIGMPWWQVVGCMTILLRIIVFPIVIKAQQNMVRMNNHQPQIQKFQVEENMANMKGDKKTAMMLNRGMAAYFKEHDCHPIKSLLPILFQGTFFTSMFFALRGMANAPVPSLTTGGLAWFTDLSISDPLFLLPIMTSSTLALQLYLGADGINTATMPAFMKKIMYVMPIMSLPFMVQFPAVLNLYWLTNNIISVFQATVIRSESMRAKFGIEKQIMWKPEDLPMTNFYQEMKVELDRQHREEEKKKLHKNKEEYLHKKAQDEKKQKLLNKIREENVQLKEENRKLKHGQKQE